MNNRAMQTTTLLNDSEMKEFISHYTPRDEMAKRYFGNYSVNPENVLDELRKNNLLDYVRSRTLLGLVCEYLLWDVEECFSGFQNKPQQLLRRLLGSLCVTYMNENTIVYDKLHVSEGRGRRDIEPGHLTSDRLFTYCSPELDFLSHFAFRLVYFNQSNATLDASEKYCSPDVFNAGITQSVLKFGLLERVPSGKDEYRFIDPAFAQCLAGRFIASKLMSTYQEDPQSIMRVEKAEINEIPGKESMDQVKNYVSSRSRDPHYQAVMKFAEMSLKHDQDYVNGKELLSVLRHSHPMRARLFFERSNNSMKTSISKLKSVPEVKLELTNISENEFELKLSDEQPKDLPTSRFFLNLWQVLATTNYKSEENFTSDYDSHSIRIHSESAYAIRKLKKALQISLGDIVVNVTVDHTENILQMRK